MNGPSLVGHEKVPCRFGLRTGDPGNTADGAGNSRRPASRAGITGKNWGLAESQTSILLLTYSTPDWPDWAKGGRKDCVCFWVFQGFLVF